jgi:hypothetical protein
MVTREKRLAGFQVTPPSQADGPVQVLCEDKRGTYVPPFACRWGDNVWLNAVTGEPITAEVIGWRLYQRQD